MATTLLSAGIVVQPVQNQIYALPPCRCLLAVNGAGVTVEGSNDGVTFAAITLTNNQAEVGVAFIRITSAAPGPIVVNKM